MENQNQSCLQHRNACVVRQSRFSGLLLNLRASMMKHQIDASYSDWETHHAQKSLLRNNHRAGCVNNSLRLQCRCDNVDQKAYEIADCSSLCQSCRRMDSDTSLTTLIQMPPDYLHPRHRPLMTHLRYEYNERERRANEQKHRCVFPDHRHQRDHVARPRPRTTADSKAEIRTRGTTCFTPSDGRGTSDMRLDSRLNELPHRGLEVLRNGVRFVLQHRHVLQDVYRHVQEQWCEQFLRRSLSNAVGLERKHLQEKISACRQKLRHIQQQHHLGRRREILYTDGRVCLEATTDGKWDMSDYASYPPAFTAVKAVLWDSNGTENYESQTGDSCIHRKSLNTGTSELSHSRQHPRNHEHTVHQLSTSSAAPQTFNSHAVGDRITWSDLLEVLRAHLKSLAITASDSDADAISFALSATRSHLLIHLAEEAAAAAADARLESASHCFIENVEVGPQKKCRGSRAMSSVAEMLGNLRRLCRDGRHATEEASADSVLTPHHISSPPLFPAAGIDPSPHPRNNSAEDSPSGDIADERCNGVRNDDWANERDDVIASHRIPDICSDEGALKWMEHLFLASDSMLLSDFF